MTSLLKKLIFDVPSLNENSLVALRVLTNHHERCGRYYGSGGGTATDEEKRLTMMLFSGIFDSLAQRAYDPELFSKALPCLSAIACALPPDYSLTSAGSSYMEQLAQDVDSTYVPNPVDSARQQLNGPLFNLSKEFSEHFHDSWSMVKIDQGWTVGATYDEISKQHPNLRPFDQLPDREKIRYVKP